jgi:hypothetical protein
LAMASASAPGTMAIVFMDILGSRTPFPPMGAAQRGLCQLVPVSRQ